MNLDKPTIKNIRWLIVFTLLIFIVLWKIEAVGKTIGFLIGIVAPFLIGAAVAFILSVPMGRIEYCIVSVLKHKPHKWLRPVSLILTLLLVIGIVALAVLVVFPELLQTFTSLGKTIQQKVPIVLAEVEKFLEGNEELSYWLSDLNLDWKDLMERAVTFLHSGAGVFFGSAFVVAQGIFSGVTTFVISFVFACYVLVQKENLSRQCKKVLYAYCKETHANRVLEVLRLIHRTFSNFLTGQCLEAVILGTMFFVAMTVLQFPYALLVGVLIAITALIPVFGAFIGCIVGAFLILVASPVKAVGFVILFLVLQQIEGNFIYPKVVGGSVGLPSIWVLVAVTVGGSLMGIVGMLTFIPLLSVIYSLFRQDVNARLGNRHPELELHE